MQQGYRKPLVKMDNINQLPDVIEELCDGRRKIDEECKRFIHQSLVNDGMLWSNVTNENGKNEQISKLQEKSQISNSINEIYEKIKQLQTPVSNNFIKQFKEFKSIILYHTSNPQHGFTLHNPPIVVPKAVDNKLAVQQSKVGTSLIQPILRPQAAHKLPLNQDITPSTKLLNDEINKTREGLERLCELLKNNDMEFEKFLDEFDGRKILKIIILIHFDEKQSAKLDVNLNNKLLEKLELSLDKKAIGYNKSSSFAKIKALNRQLTELKKNPSDVKTKLKYRHLRDKVYSDIEKSSLEGFVTVLKNNSSKEINPEAVAQASASLQRKSLFSNNFPASKILKDENSDKKEVDTDSQIAQSTQNISEKKDNANKKTGALFRTSRPKKTKNPIPQNNKESAKPSLGSLPDINKMIENTKNMIKQNTIRKLSAIPEETEKDIGINGKESSIKQTEKSESSLSDIEDTDFTPSISSQKRRGSLDLEDSNKNTNITKTLTGKYVTETLENIIYNNASKVDELFKDWSKSYNYDDLASKIIKAYNVASGSYKLRGEKSFGEAYDKLDKISQAWVQKFLLKENSVVARNNSWNVGRLKKHLSIEKDVRMVFTKEPTKLEQKEVEKLHQTVYTSLKTDVPTFVKSINKDQGFFEEKFKLDEKTKHITKGKLDIAIEDAKENNEDKTLTFSSEAKFVEGATHQNKEYNNVLKDSIVALRNSGNTECELLTENPAEAFYISLYLIRAGITPTIPEDNKVLLESAFAKTLEAMKYLGKFGMDRAMMDFDKYLKEETLINKFNELGNGSHMKTVMQELIKARVPHLFPEEPKQEQASPKKPGF